MIIQLLIQVILAGLTIIFGWLPKATELPWGMDEYLADGVGYVKGFSEYFPFIAVVMDAFLIYLGFRLSLLIMNFVLGSRTPQHHG